MNITSATLASYVAYSTTNSTKRQTVAASAAEGQTVASPSISQAAQDALQASLAAGSSSSPPSSSIPFMQILETENSLNPNPTAAQSASASAYASNPSADPQFLAVSGTTPFNMPSSTPGEQQLIGNPMSGATIAGIEKQLGVIAVYGTNPEGQVDEAAGINLYDDNGNPIQNGDPRMQEWQLAIARANQAQQSSNVSLPSVETAASATLEATSSSIVTSNADALISILQST